MSQKTRSENEQPDASGKKRSSKVDGFIHLLGVLNDTELARRAGVTAGAVRNKRIALGIGTAPVSRSKGEEPAQPEARAESSLPPEKKFRRGGKKSVIDDHIHLLGTMSDGDVALRAGATREAVSQYRRHRNIPAFRDGRGNVDGNDSFEANEAPTNPKATANPSVPEVKRTGKRSAIDNYYDLLGTMTDQEVANKAGVSVAAVAKYRRRRGITASQPRSTSGGQSAVSAAAAPVAAPAAASVTEKVAAKPAAAPAKRAAGSLVAFVVVIRAGGNDKSFIVTGADITEAASSASKAAGGGEIVRIERYLDVL